VANVFPPFPCDTNLAISPYTLSPPIEEFGRICFIVNVVTPKKKSPCNTMDFYKLVLDVRESSEDSSTKPS